MIWTKQYKNETSLSDRKSKIGLHNRTGLQPLSKLHNGTFLHDGQRCGSSAVHHYKYTPLDSAVKYPALSQRCAPLSLQMQRLRAALCRLAAAVITLN
jgi:hypothetical protein